MCFYYWAFYTFNWYFLEFSTIYFYKNHVRFRWLRSRISDERGMSILSEHRLISSDFRPSIFPQLHQPFFLETIDGGAIIWTIVVMDRQRFKYSFPIQMKNIATSLRKRTKRQKEKEKNSWKWRKQKSSYDQFAFGQRNANRASMTRKTIKFFKNFHLNATANLFLCFSSTYFSECHISIKYCYKY